MQNLLLLSKRNRAILPVGNLKGGISMKEKPDVLQGTLALMVLKTLDVLGPQHGYGIARRIEQISGDLLAVNQGTLYPLLLKLEQEGSRSRPSGASSENNRRAPLLSPYREPAEGSWVQETREWEQTAAIIARFFQSQGRAPEMKLLRRFLIRLSNFATADEGAPTNGCSEEIAEHLALQTEENAARRHGGYRGGATGRRLKLGSLLKAIREQHHAEHSLPLAGEPGASGPAVCSSACS